MTQFGDLSKVKNMSGTVSVKRFLLLLTLTACSLHSGASPLKRVSPERVGMDSRVLERADSAINDAIAKGDIPGAVFAVVRHDRIALLKAYGHQQVWPAKVPMQTGTVFDMASCSKAMSTAICTLMLCDEGRIRLQDAVNRYIPDFEDWTASNGKKEAIRICHLLTHTSGLPAYASVETLEKKYGAPCPDALLQHICHVKRAFAPENDFRYSCLNYIVLQHIIEKVSGESLRQYALDRIFHPLQMSYTDYFPCAPDAQGKWTNTLQPQWAVAIGNDWKQKVAPTTRQEDGSLLQAMVHDPLARRLNGGVSGNAGLFSTADDIAVFCAMLQNDGEWQGKRILSRQSAALLRTVPRFASDFGRTYGWDNRSPYASCNGDLFSEKTYSHTGFTGTSIVIDPVLDCSVIFLCHSVHPSEGKSVVRLRSILSNIVAASIVD